MTTEPQVELSIKKSSVLPWWLFAIVGLVFLFVSWVARGVEEWLAVCVTMFAIALVIIVGGLFLSPVRQSTDWFRNLTRFAFIILIAAAGGFAIRYYFPVGTVYVENAMPFDVRIVLDGKDWLDLPADSVKKMPMPLGSHVVTVHAAKDGDKLDEDRVFVKSCGSRYVLNVLGAQTYLHGVIIYGGPESPPPHVVRDKWFEIKTVDFLFREPPEVIGVERREGELARPTQKTYFIRAKRGDEK